MTDTDWLWMELVWLRHAADTQPRPLKHSRVISTDPPLPHTRARARQHKTAVTAVPPGGDLGSNLASGLSGMPRSPVRKRRLISSICSWTGKLGLGKEKGKRISLSDSRATGTAHWSTYRPRYIYASRHNAAPSLTTEASWQPLQCPPLTAWFASTSNTFW